MTKPLFCPTLLAACLAVTLASAAGCDDADAAGPATMEAPAAPPAYLAWPASTDEEDRVVYAHAPGEEAAYVVTTAAKPDELGGDAPIDDLQTVLQRLWLEMNVVEGVSESGGRTVIWGEVDAEHGERRFAAAIDVDHKVTAFVAMPEEFEQLGGPALVGGDLARAKEAPAEMRPLPELPETDVPPPLHVKLDNGTYGPPGWTTVAEADQQEPKVTNLHVADPNDPLSPRQYHGSYKIDQFPDVNAAARAAVTQGGITDVELPLLVAAENFPKMFGIGMHVGVGRGTFRGRPRAIAATVEVNREKQIVIASVLDAPPEVMAAWNPTAAAALMTGYIKDPSVLDDATRARLLAASLQEQSAVAAKLTDLGGQMLLNEYAGMAMMQQQSTLNTMRQMNANIATQTQAIVTDGLGVGYDGLGNATLVPE